MLELKIILKILCPETLCELTVFCDVVHDVTKMYAYSGVAESLTKIRPEWVSLYHYKFPRAQPEGIFCGIMTPTRV